MSVQVHASPEPMPKWRGPMKSPPPVFSEGEGAPIEQRRNSYSRKRRGQHRNFQPKRRRSRMILPNKFLLGGNISDPLNLNGLSESDEVTPVSSPLPTGHRDNVNIIIPPNITDPLNLVESDDDANDELFYNLAHKKKKHKKKKEELTPLNVDVDVPRRSAEKISPAIPKDKIVSPVIPQTHRAHKRRRTNSECPKLMKQPDSKPTVDVKCSKTKRQNSNQKSKKKKESKFIYGNYNRYYGYRNPNLTEDPRLSLLDPNWFTGCDVLDVGCNTGHVTLAVARDFRPRRIVGLDVDGALVGIARKNIRHYLLTDCKQTETYPVSMAACYGPLTTDKIPDFPDNVFFRQGDVVLESDELLELQKPEYDVIMALSITKWIHLNHGDAGLKRTFKRFYRMLRPGGKLILEPQGWMSYGKRKKLTETIHKNYQSIRFRPENFRDFLLSRHVGFSHCLPLNLVFSQARGFRRPILVFTKEQQPEPSVTFDLPIRVRPTADVDRDVSGTPATPGPTTPFSAPGTPFSAPGTPFSAPGTPFSAPGTPGTGTPGAPSPCSVTSCTECKRQIENGFTPGSPASTDYCSQCGGARTPQTPCSIGPQTPASMGPQTPMYVDDGSHTPYGDPPSCDPEVTSSSEPVTSLETDS